MICNTCCAVHACPGCSKSVQRADAAEHSIGVDKVLTTTSKHTPDLLRSHDEAGIRLLFVTRHRVADHAKSASTGGAGGCGTCEAASRLRKCSGGR